MLRFGASHALRRQQAGDELAELDRLAVGDEVGRAAGALLGGQDEALDDVVDVGRRGQVVAAADPREAPAADQVDERRQ